MKLTIQIVLVFSVFLCAFANGRTVPKQTFEDMVKRSDLIMVASVHEGMVIDQNEDAQPVIDLRFCVEVGLILFGEVVADPVCFHANSALKVGGRYLLFLSNDEADDQGQESSNYFLLAGLEVLNPGPHHSFEAVRFEPLEHPIVPDVIEQAAIIEFENESESDEPRSVTVYSYLPLSDVQRVIRSTLNTAKDLR